MKHIVYLVAVAVVWSCASVGWAQCVHGGHDWPALTELDGLLDRGARLAGDDEQQDFSDWMEEVRTSAAALVGQKLPHGIHHPLEVKLYLDDIKEVISNASALPDSEGVIGLVDEVLPLVHTAMETAGVPHPQTEGHGPHDGCLADLVNEAGDVIGQVELKLHGDAGDLEAWLVDASGASPLDLPLDTSIAVEFMDKDGRRIELRPRNLETNEDEEGNPNIRDGHTNYFVFPGETGAPSDWLKGSAFQTRVTLRYRVEESEIATAPFVLAPHAEHHHHHHHHH